MSESRGPSGKLENAYAPPIAIGASTMDTLSVEWLAAFAHEELVNNPQVYTPQYYIDQLRKYPDGKTRNFHFAAAFFGPGWCFYRKLYIVGLVLFIVSSAIGLVGGWVGWGLLIVIRLILVPLPEILPERRAQIPAFACVLAALRCSRTAVRSAPLLAENPALVPSLPRQPGTRSRGARKNRALRTGNLKSRAVALGAIATRLYLAKAADAAAHVRALNLPREQSLEHLARQGGTSVLAVCAYGMLVIASSVVSYVVMTDTGSLR